jgi:hypothetical protein
VRAIAWDSNAMKGNAVLFSAPITRTLVSSSTVVSLVCYFPLIIMVSSLLYGTLYLTPCFVFCSTSYELTMYNKI